MKFPQTMILRDTAVECRTAPKYRRTRFRRPTAVSPMQGALASLPPHSTTLSREFLLHLLFA